MFDVCIWFGVVMVSNVCGFEMCWYCVYVLFGVEEFMVLYLLCFIMLLVVVLVCIEGGWWLLFDN